MIKDLKSRLVHPLIHVNPWNGMHCAQHEIISNITKDCLHNRKLISNLKCCIHGTDEPLLNVIIFVNIISRFAKLAI